MNADKRTDLAAELDLTDRENITETTERIGKITVTTVEIRTEAAAKRIGKPIGKYVTLDIGKIWLASDDDFENTAGAISEKLTDITKKLCGSIPKSILIAGLGNRRITADALGDEAVGLITVTRHLKGLNKRLFTFLGGREISAVAPGVLGQTGVEAAETVFGICEQIKPELVVAIDSLCARSTERLATTVQLGTSGITPGSGIGNHRRAITQDVLGVPVIAFGVPTVVESSALVYDALFEAGITEPDERLIKVLENRRGFFVTPKETDTIVRELSRLTARALTLTFGGL